MTWVAGAHMLAIVHGLAAVLACAACFYAGGLALLPRRAAVALGDGESPAILGAAVYVLVCWFGVTTFRVPVLYLAPAFSLVVVVLAAIRRRWLAAELRRRFGPSGWQWLAVFCGFYVLMYVFTLPSVTGEFLPPAWLGNIDLMTYVRYSQHALRLGPSNLASYPDFDYLGFVYLQTPAVFHLLGGLSFLFRLDLLAATMPAAFGLAALTGFLAARIARTVFGLSLAAATTIGAVLLSGPFFRYIFGQYFLSTLMSTPVFLFLVWTTAVRRPSRTVDAALALPFLGAYVLLLLLYPLLLGVGVAAQAAVVVLLYLAERQRGAVGQSAAAHAARSAAQRLATIVASLGILVIGLFSRVVWSFEEVVYLTQPNINGWPFDLISPLAILGAPAAWTNLEKCRACVDFEVVSASGHAWSMAFVALLAVGVSALYHPRLAASISPPERALAAVGGGAFAAYIVFFLGTGPSYQQWKFASYTALPWSFALLAALTRVATLSAPAAGVATPRRTAIGLSALAALLIGGNLVAHAHADPALTQFPATLRNVSALNADAGFREISVMMDETVDGLASWLALYLLPDKQVHVISRRNVPHEELVYDSIAPERPLLRQNFGCEGIGHQDTRDIPDVGCLLLAPPSLAPEHTYPFNQTFWFVSFTGLGAREPEGRWNTDGVVHMELMADVKRAPLFDDHFVNLRLTPYLPPGTAAQRLALSWGKGSQGEMSLTSTAVVSLPIGRSDWTGLRMWTLPLTIELPDRVTPPSMYAPKGHADGPPLAAVFEEVSITRLPRGTVVQPMPAREGT